MKALHVSVSPHITSSATTSGIMLDVILSLLPATVASAVLFGMPALALVASCVGSAVIAEYLFCVIVKKAPTITDLSAVVTGLLLALNLPSQTPLWQAVLGTVFAIVVVKCLFGGIGQNFANPAITARVMMLLSFGSHASVGIRADFVSGATPLHPSADPANFSYLNLLFGNHGGAVGETCALALLIGGLYLLIRRVISWHTPVAYIGTVFLLSWALGQDPVYQILSGGLLIGAVFMATDYATSPNNKLGKLIFGLGCGIITVAIRTWGNYPEGVSFAILFMNILTPYIESWTRSKPMGGAKA